jgi:hypothetical protein
MAKEVKAKNKKNTKVVTKSIVKSKSENKKMTEKKLTAKKSQAKQKQLKVKSKTVVKTVKLKPVKEVKKEKVKVEVKTKPTKITLPATPKNTMKSVPSEQVKSTMIAAPTEAMLKPFRDAAKRIQSKVSDKKKNAKKGNFLAKPLKTGKKLYIDLRVHSPASEGYFSTGGVDPAAAMVRLAKAKGLDMIAVTDYHSAEFVDTVKSKAQATTVTVIPGIDLKCAMPECSDINLVALFPENYSSQELNKVLDKLKVPNSKKGLKNFTIELPIKEVISIVESNGGIIIPSRLDKTPHRMKALPELIEKFGFHVFDLAHPDQPEEFRDKWPAGEFTFLSFSNANALGQIGARAIGTKLSTSGFSGIKSLVSRR